MEFPARLIEWPPLGKSPLRKTDFGEKRPGSGVARMYLQGHAEHRLGRVEFAVSPVLGATYKQLLKRIVIHK